jgi:hypothetical protein
MARYQKGSGKFSSPTYGQAAHIVRKFGGEGALAKILGISRITIYRWQYAKPVGTDGLIPAHNVELITSAGREYGILITPQDWLPRKIDYEAEAATQEAHNGKTLAELLG